jgi:sugar phosphate isomerase/epimerase
LPGEGHIDFKKLIRMLNDAGYTGFAALEVLNIPSAQHIIENAKSRIGAIKPEV